MHRIRRRVLQRLREKLIGSPQSLLIRLCSRIRAENPRYPPTLHLQKCPDAVANDTEPHQPNEALPKRDREQQKGQQKKDGKDDSGNSVSFFSALEQAFSRLIVPCAEREPQDGLKVQRQ
jgi:hypothetical protein